MLTGSSAKESEPRPPLPPRPAGRLLRQEADFRRIYLSQLVSLGGDWFAMIPLLALLQKLTDGPLWGALVLAADTLVIAVMSPYAGVVVDRVDRRRLMVLCDLLSAGFIATLFLVRSGSTAWIALVALGGVAGVKAFYGPAASAALPNLVPTSDLLTANALSGGAWGVMLAVGASLGALLASVLGIDWCFALDVVTFCVSAALVGRVRKPFGDSRDARPRARVRDDLRETASFAREDRRIVALLLAKPGTALGNGVLALFPALGAAVFHVGDVGVGLLYAARGVGALIGPVTGRRLLSGREGRIRVLTLASTLTFGAAYAGFSTVTWFPLAVLLVVAAHVGGSMNSTLSSFALQSATPDGIRGRVLSVDFMFSTLSLGASQLVAGGLATAMAPSEAALCIAGIVIAYGTLWWTLSGELWPRRTNSPPVERG
ncbi:MULTISPECIES: MFS transporter [Streptacidiphilus]|uniref:MFS transporter n=2 Tax=Streptacidiphilus TaxID=228398 RepID=A0ABV6UTX6_9ACTN|nr:MFS transporter [Streptacidiphilus jeojiense]